MSKHTSVDYDLMRKRMVDDGLSNKQICERTGLTQSTVSAVRRKVFRELMAEHAKAQVFASPLVKPQCE